MRKMTFLVALAAVAWLDSAGCGPGAPGEDVRSAGLAIGAGSGAGSAPADTQSIVTRRLLAGIADMPMGSPSPDGRYLTDVDWDTGDLAIRDLQAGQARHITNEGYEVGYAETSRVSPDGRWVAYTWYEPDATRGGATHPGIRVISIEGGESRVMVSNAGNQYAYPFGWSADGSQVLVGLVRSDGTNQIGLVDVADAELRIVKALGRAGSSHMALSPDGRFVAYDVQREASYEHTVHIVAADGSGDQEVTGPVGHNVVIGWEPSGRHLLYYGDHSGSPSVWALETADGRPRGEPILVRSDLWHLIPLGFTAEGDLLYGVTTGKVDVYTVLTDLETGAPIGLPESVTPHYQAGTAQYPRWSPDGRYLAYRWTPPNGGGRRNSLVIRAVETGEFREIGLDLTLVSALNWSSDGRFLVFWGREGRDRDGIYRIDAQTGEHGFAHVVAGGMRGAAWVDDGRTVVYRETSGGAPPGWCRFVTVELSSGREREIYRWRCYSKDWFWTLSPDRRTIAGVFDHAGDLARDAWTIRLVSLDDGVSRDLATLYPWVGDNGAGRLPVSEIYWTPDSRTFRFRGCTSPDELNKALNRCPNWSFDVTTGERRRLADDAPMGSIHPDGRRVAFADGKTANEVWVMEGYLPIRDAGSGRNR